MADDTRQRMEDEWFARNEEELLRQARRAHEQRLQDLTGRQIEGEARRLRELHYLKCPKCGHDMSSRTLEGIEIEECGTCQGLFFDRGELDSLLLKQSEERRGFFRKLIGM
ncbi:MAG TPA: zf-TFIIB domain-containing protein [Candidatus Polarisedimenticolia bacterium]|nr:zf-TFIIB domain-containing protein [Candidatus Polarisedimenticolia bacterium]